MGYDSFEFTTLICKINKKRLKFYGKTQHSKLIKLESFRPKMCSVNENAL